MGDISSSKTRQISKAVFKDMIKRVTSWLSSHSNKPPNIVYLNKATQKEWVTWARYNDMKARWDAWKKKYGSEPNYVWVIARKSTTTTTTTPKTPEKNEPLPSTPKSASQTLIYVKAIAITNYSDSASVYTTETVPYTSCNINRQSHGANIATFESPRYYQRWSQVHIIGKHAPFGGQIQDVIITPHGYQYECIDYTHQLFGKMAISEKKVKVGDLIKKILKGIGMPTNGIKATSKVHDKIVIREAKRIDIIQQLANLEGLQFLVNEDGIPVLKTEPAPVSGFVFYPFGVNANLSDRSREFNSSERITGVLVWGKDDELMYKKFDASLISKIGFIEEFITNSNITSASKAKTLVNNLYKEKAKTEFVGTLTIPRIINIKECEWCLFVNDTDVYAYYVQTVDTNVGEETTTVQLTNGRPTPPSEWIYTDTVGNALTGTTTTKTTYRPVWLNMDCTYNTKKDQNIANTILNSVKAKGLTTKFFAYCHSFGSQYDFTKAPSNALVVTILSGADAAYFKEKTSAWFKSKLGKRKHILIFMETAKRITGLAWLPRAHDDNYSPRSFTGVKNPASVLKSAGISYIEGLSPNKLQPAVDFIVKQATLTTTTTTSGSAGGNVTTPKGVTLFGTTFTTPKQVHNWINAHIKYQFYYDHKYSVSQVVSRGAGNCVDQALLFIYIVEKLGYTARLACGKVCNGYGHCNAEIKINGRWIVEDSTCSKLNRL